MNDSNPSRAAIIRSIVGKDLRVFLTDRLWVFLTIFGITWMVIIYYLMPTEVDETIQVGVHWTDADAAYEMAFPEGEGIEFVRFDSADELEEALGMGDDEPDELLSIGLDYPEDFLVRVAVGEDTKVRLLVDPGVPEEVREIMAIKVREGAFALTGNTTIGQLLDLEETVLGDDRLGKQVTTRELFRPFIVFAVLMIETMVLGTLIASEVSSRTVSAVLATPARTGDFLAAKSLVGTTVAFTEAVVLLLLLQALGQSPLVMLVTVLLGAILVTGVALIAGAAGRDMIGTVFFSMLFMVPMMIPLVAAMFPGTSSLWVKMLPTYGLVQTIVRTTVYDARLSEVLPYLAGLAAWCAIAYLGGLLVLKRKVESL